MLWRAVLLLFLSTAALPLTADDVLFIGNSFTFAAEAPAVHRHGGVPKLFEAIANAEGQHVTTQAVTSPGKDWGYHLAQPVTAAALHSHAWTWVVLQDQSTEPTHIGDVPKFLRDGVSLAERIMQTSPHAGIVLYETWARPAGRYYQKGAGSSFSGPKQMMAELRDAYHRLDGKILQAHPHLQVRVAPVGSAFEQIHDREPALNLDARDRHHATVDGYYLAALVIYETIYHQSVRGAPTTFFNRQVVIPTSEAADLQRTADQLAGNPSSSAVAN